MIKPHIQKLLDTVGAYAISISKANYQEQQYKEAKEALKMRLQNLGIADKFDWYDIAE